MAMQKHGSVAKIKVVKQGSFTLDENYIAAQIEKQWPDKQITLDQLHDGLKSIGVVNYSSDDMNALVGRLQAIGFKISK